VFFEDQNTPGNAQAGHALDGVRVGVRFGHAQRWDLSACLDNATDKRYLVDAGNTAACLARGRTSREIRTCTARG